MFKIKNFTPVMDSMVLIYGPTRALIFGSVWRYCQMSPKNECTAAIEKIARRVAVSPRTALRHIKLLCDDKYLEDLTPELRNKPHTYRDTGKVLMEMGMTESHSDYDRESYRGMTESHSHYDRESLEETSKKLLKKKEETPPPIIQKTQRTITLITTFSRTLCLSYKNLLAGIPPSPELILRLIKRND